MLKQIERSKKYKKLGEIYMINKKDVIKTSENGAKLCGIYQFDVATHEASIGLYSIDTEGNPSIILKSIPQDVLIKAGTELDFLMSIGDIHIGQSDITQIRQTILSCMMNANNKRFVQNKKYSLKDAYEEIVEHLVQQEQKEKKSIPSETERNVLIRQEKEKRYAYIKISYFKSLFETGGSLSYLGYEQDEIYKNLDIVLEVIYRNKPTRRDYALKVSGLSKRYIKMELKEERQDE